MKIRKATIKDLQNVTDLHLRSFKVEDHIPMILGPRYIKATYRWLVTSNDSYVLVAYNEDSIVGLVAVCDGSFMKPMFIACLPEFILGLIMKPQLLFSGRLWSRLFRQTDQAITIKDFVNDPGVAQMTIGAIDSNYRGMGIFGELVEATKEACKARGSKAIRAGIYERNLSSRKVFIKAGWKEIVDLRTEDTVCYVTFLDRNFEKNFSIS